MASIPTTILNFLPGALAATYTSASFTPVVSTRLIVFGCAYKATALASKPTVTSTALTWTEIGNYHNSTFANPDLWVVGWISSVVPASPAAMTVTVAAAAAAGIALCVVSVPSVDTDGTVVQFAGGEDLASGDPSFTFGAVPGANNLVIGCNWMGGPNAITKPTGYTNLFDNTPTNLVSRRAEVFYDNTSAAKGPNQSTSTNIRSIVLAIELGVTAAPAITRIQGTSGNDLSGTYFASFPMSFSVPVTSGNTVIVCWSCTGPVTVTITDDKSNVYTMLPADWMGTYGVGIGYCINATNGPKVISANFSPSTPYASLIIEEFSGVLAYDSTNGNTSAASTYPTGTVTPAGNGALLFTNCWAESSGPITVNSPFTYLQQAGSFNNVADGWYVQPIAAAIQATWNPPSSQNGVARIVAFTPGTAAAPSGRAKVWSGTAWVIKPTKVWSGSAWVAKPAKIWTGSLWKT